MSDEFYDVMNWRIEEPEKQADFWLQKFGDDLRHRMVMWFLRAIAVVGAFRGW